MLKAADLRKKPVKQLSPILNPKVFLDEKAGLVLKDTPEQVLWSGRFKEKPDVEAFAFQASIAVDKRLAHEDIAGSRAHVAMLAKQGIITADTAHVLDRELERIAGEISEGSLAIDLNAEDIHSFIEQALAGRLGDAGRMVHAGRSRNDQVAVDFRLYLKKDIPKLRGELAAVITVLLDKATAHAETIMPGYTHLQRAQPITLGYHLTAWCCALDRDRSRLADAMERLDECPLGSGALAGSTLPLDREYAAKALGFKRPTLNAMDSVADRDFAVEIAAAISIIMIHLSRFCEDIVLWASEEFRFINLDESYSTGSSIMPQKKNPDFAELIRGKSARTTGNLVSLLTLLKGLPYAYNKDLQEDKEALFDSIDTVAASLRIFRGMIDSAVFNAERMKSACAGGFLEATDAAEYLVRKGMPFRKAHEIAALLVRDCIAMGLASIAGISLEKLKESSSLFEEDLYSDLKPEACVNKRKTLGGPAPEELRRQIEELRQRLQNI
jgi:argininosuccinate lyase